MKKFLAVSAAAVFGLISTIAFADSLAEMVSATSIASAGPAAAVSPASLSANTGIRLGVEGGLGFTHWKHLGNMWGDVGTLRVDKDRGFVGRIFIGYDINRYFAVETGYSYFFNKVYMNDDYPVDGSSTVRTQAIDLLGKGKLPVVDNFDLYAKVGAVCLISNISPNFFNSGTNTSINAAFGAGADYYISPNIIANIEWLHNMGYSKTNQDQYYNTKYQPDTDAVMIGLSYKFIL